MKEPTVRSDLIKDGYSKEEKYFSELNERLKRELKRKLQKETAPESSPEKDEESESGLGLADEH